MSSAEEASWRVRPDRGALAKGVGVLIDTEYLSSDSEARRMNPYFIVIDGNRYYGPTPEEVVQTAREHPDVKARIKGEAAFRANATAAPQQTALPSGRTMKNRAAGAWQSAKAAAAAAAAAAKNRFKSKAAASGAAASGAAASGAAASGAAASGAQLPPAKQLEGLNKAQFAGQSGPTDKTPLMNNMSGGKRKTTRKQRSRHRR